MINSRMQTKLNCRCCSSNKLPSNDKFVALRMLFTDVALRTVELREGEGEREEREERDDRKRPLEFLG